jgi:exonuclease SbcC
MLITRLELEHIKSYRHVAIDFRRGTTAISGENGAGKTTLVEAIGFALFGYLPYNQDQFVREGEKYGKVTINLLGGDERPYVIERRCGSSSYWRLFDQDADLRLEQRADVTDKLHEIFGIDSDRPLDSLFRDALGVPQGTFTAIFLETASKRKQTFDALLQIEDYKTAADNLLETQKIYKEQMNEQKSEIQRLTLLTRDLDARRLQLQDARLLDEQYIEQNALWSKQQNEYEQLVSSLNEQLKQLQSLEQRFKNARTNYDHAYQLLHEREAQLLAARKAEQHVQASQQDYQRYQQTQETLTRLRQDVRQRDRLRQQLAKDDNARTKSESALQNLQDRLAEVEVARQQISQLTPLIERQAQLEEQCDGAKQQVARYEQITKELRRLQAQQEKYQQDQQKLQQRIASIEPLLPLAELLQQRSDTLTQLRIQASEQKTILQQRAEKEATYQKKLAEQGEAIKKLNKDEKNLALIEVHRQEAEEMPALQEQCNDLIARKNRLEGNIEGYLKSRAQSAGGQCPLLNEACLNIRQRGMASLESYFDDLLATEYAQINLIAQQQLTVELRISQVKKYADALAKIDQYTDRRNIYAKQVQGISYELEHLKQEISALTQTLEQLEDIDQQVVKAERSYKESKDADTKIRELAGLYKQTQQIQEQLHHYALEYQERQQEAHNLQGCYDQLQTLSAELAALNNPRARYQAQQEIATREESYRQQLRNEQQKLETILQKITHLGNQLAVYSTLDTEITQQEELQRQSSKGYQLYLTYQQEAQQLAGREQACTQQANLTQQAQQQLQESERAYQTASAAFHQQELTDAQTVLQQLRTDLATLAQKMKHHQDLIRGLELQISEGETHMAALEVALHEYQTLEDLSTMTEQFRKLIKEAAPHVLKAMLADISAEANRIFGEIIGDRSAQLSWRKDYEIILRRQGTDRSFSQLSGGEQMSAALAVRLALLKKLSTLNIAFFDEPTQNMDELRRMNLAEQIRRVRGFDQLFVISHDDTFEQGLDSMVRLTKVHGETQVAADVSSDARESVEALMVF